MGSTPSEPLAISNDADSSISATTTLKGPPFDPAESSGTATDEGSAGAKVTAVDPEFPASPNPWDTPSPAENEVKNESKPIVLPDTPLLGQSAFSESKSDSPTSVVPQPPVSEAILSEFDPLANREEQAAKSAWESSESHPPPPRTPSPPPPSLPEKDEPSSSRTSPSSGSEFPSFSALARTFALPLTPLAPRPRPQSIDVARPVASPATLSSFASQQDAPSRSAGSDQQKNASRSNTPLAAGSGTASPVPGTRGDKPGEAQFDFQRFLDQMKSKSAEPVSKYLRSFLSNFAKRTFTVNDQVKIINDFLSFIAQQMRNCDVWKNASDDEFDNAMEGMEKLVMNRLYDFTFTPQLERAQPPRPITTDDLEKDRVLSQRIALFGWVEEKHLDIPEGEGGKGFLMFAQQELLKINHYKAPRDKLICILNSCKVIFGLIRHLKKEEGADSFLPILIFVVLKANPEHLLSNVEFINRFRNPEKLQSEAGYYLSSLMGAVSFIETMDHTSLSNIDQEEFEKNVEAAIQALPPSEPSSPQTPFAEAKIRPHMMLSPTSHVGEESAQPLSLSTPAQSLSDHAERLLQKTGDTISKPLSAIGRIFSDALDGAENKLSYLPGPFAPFELGREQRQQGLMGGPPVPESADGRWPQHISQQYPATPQSAAYPQTPYGPEGGYVPNIQTPYKARQPKRGGPAGYSPSGPWGSSSPGGSPGYGYGSGEETPSRAGPQTNLPLAIGPSQQLPALVPPRVNLLAHAEAGGHISRTPTPALDLAAVQQQIDAAQNEEVKENRRQLAQIFPETDSEVVDWVLEANGGDLGKSIEALLEMNSGE
ncbi:guanine nucleotide exchange factor Vps9 [Ephemerocybe angulata]|uniref:Guanine nucleotide exchange factor Vps9 n=1 Tax=Ephemerocybe angulata TaxID=980116 RepID=A0A8H6IA48_9AGAR|nr:guanine nucleotide exchange factor Vps9 [Tulosesus angulatus]